MVKLRWKLGHVSRRDRAGAPFKRYVDLLPGTKLSGVIYLLLSRLALPYPQETFPMRLIELLNVKGLSVAGMNFPFDAKVVVSPGQQKIRHLIEAVVFILPILGFAASDDKPDSIKKACDLPRRSRERALDLHF